MDFQKLTDKFKDENNLIIRPRPYTNHSVRFKKSFTAEDRWSMLRYCGFNVFFFPSEMVTGCDLLSDSGTTTMTDSQWASMLLADEAYGSNVGYFELLKQVHATFGEEFECFFFHQGRPAEDALFTFVGRLGKNMVIPSNGHFDTTQANIEANDIKTVNLFSSTLSQNRSKDPFKGNMDVGALAEILYASKKGRVGVPLVYLTITNNTGGGQPVSLENIKKVSHLAHMSDAPFFLDACRFAENAWFIKKHEEGYKNKSIKEIVSEIFSCADGFTMSFKKDGLANMGGGVFIKQHGLFYEKYPQARHFLADHQIIKEGHPTYGGLSGRDIMTICEGLKLVTKEEYLNHRIGQVRQFGNAMVGRGLPVLTPFGGHAIYLDVNKFFDDTSMKPEDFGGISFTAFLLGLYGHRACELGNFAFGSYDKTTKNEFFPKMNYVRFAVPRLKYEKQDLDSIAWASSELYKNRNEIPGVNVIYGKDLSLRHFKARFEFKS